MCYLGGVFSGDFKFYIYVDYMVAKVQHAFDMHLRVLRNRGGLDTMTPVVSVQKQLQAIEGLRFDFILLVIPTQKKISSYKMHRGLNLVYIQSTLITLKEKKSMKVI